MFVPRTAPFDNSITVNACKYDGSLHRAWRCELIEETSDHWLFAGAFEEQINHPLLGVIRPGTVSYEFYWKTRWYNVFCFYEPSGEFRSFYCNVNQPPIFEDNLLRYVDLDIDVLVQPDLAYRIVDLDEFAENTFKYKYPPELTRQALASLDELTDLIENRKFPFGS